MTVGVRLGVPPSLSEFLCGWNVLWLMSRWLGQNSKQGKLGRQLTDIQIRMRLRASGSRQEIRETYMPMLASKIVSPLTEKGAVSWLFFVGGLETDPAGCRRGSHQLYGRILSW